MQSTSPNVVAEIQDILREYDLGDLVNFNHNERGYLNISYVIETIKDGRRSKYFLRRYRSNIQEPEVQFEHSVITHLLDQGFSLIAGVIENRQGTTYLKKIEEGNPIYYAVFDYLEGEDKYTWVDPNCSPEEMGNAASVLASFHDSVVDLRPKGKRFVSKICELLPEIADQIQQCPSFSKGMVFDSYLQEHIPLILRNCEVVQSKLKAENAGNLQQMVVHGDYHPGNLKFEESTIVGLFDFDWSNFDLRCFDVGLALWYFVTDWKKKSDGHIRLKDLDLFLDSYQSSVRRYNKIEPLSEIELRILPSMINAGNLYVLKWTVSDYYDNDVPSDEYMVYLQHSVKFCQWYEQGGEQLLTNRIESSLNLLES